MLCLQRRHKRALTFVSLDAKENNAKQRQSNAKSTPKHHHSNAKVPPEYHHSNANAMPQQLQSITTAMPMQRKPKLKQTPR